MSIIARPTDKVMNVNLTYEDMSKPVAGPQDPFNQRKNKGMNSLAGHVEEQAMDSYTFAMQQRTFEVKGYALNPSADGAESKPFIGSLDSAHENGYASIDGLRTSRKDKREMKRKRAGKGDLSVVDGEGAYVGPWASWEQDKQEEVVEVEDEPEEWREEKRRREEAKEKAMEKVAAAREEKSIFHGGFFVVKLTLTIRQRAHRLRWTDIYAYSDGQRRQAQPCRWSDTTQCLRAGAMYTYMGEFRS